MEHYDFLKEAFGLYGHVNALQRDMCPSQTRFEGEIIAMTLDMLHGGAAAAEPVRETLPEALFELDHGGGSRPCWAEPAPAMRRPGCGQVAAQ